MALWSKGHEVKSAMLSLLSMLLFHWISLYIRAPYHIGYFITFNPPMGIFYQPYGHPRGQCVFSTTAITRNYFVTCDIQYPISAVNQNQIIILLYFLGFCGEEVVLPLVPFWSLQHLELVPQISLQIMRCWNGSKRNHEGKWCEPVLEHSHALCATLSRPLPVLSVLFRVLKIQKPRRHYDSLYLMALTRNI